MRILQVHNFYQQAGGEDRVLQAEEELLTANGHEVFQYTVHNDAVNAMPDWSLGLKTIWNGDTYAAVRRRMAEQGIALAHVHNTLPLISPAVYYAAAAQRVPVIQTLHNYRLLCPAATFYRQGAICELCSGKSIKYPAVKYRCYRGGLGASAAVTTMLAVHRLAGTYRQRIHTYIALTEFARGKFCADGLPAERIVVKPNFLMKDPGVGDGSGGYALFVGRLSEEKGLAALLDAWSEGSQTIPLKIAGAGPLEKFVASRAGELPSVEYLGHCGYERVIELLKGAVFLMLPSRWYEGMPMAVLESMACGTPVVAFGLGSLNELIREGVNGFKLAGHDAAALAQFLKNPGELTAKCAGLRASTRAHFEAHFTAKANYPLLLGIYKRALDSIVR